MVFACSDSTETESDVVLITCSPASTNFQATLGDTVAFQVTREPSGSMDVEWIIAEEVVSTDAVFFYVATSRGLTHISVSVFVDGAETLCTWDLNVIIGDSQPPPSIFSLNVNHGMEIGEIVVSWPRVIPNEYPISHYLLVYSTAGPVYAETWDQAESLGRVEEITEGNLHSVSFNAESGILGGVTVWLGAVAVDERGMRSVVPGGGSIIPSYPWFIHGLIYGDNGLPLHNVFVDLGYSHTRVYTNQAGEFTGGPFSSRETINLFTISSDTPDEGSGFFDSYYDVEVEDIVADGDVALEISLIARYGIDETCTHEIYSGDFLNFFMEMTKTRHPTGGRSNRRLYKWEQYPVPVFIPEYINEDGVDMAALSRSGMELWNTIMEEEYFTLVDNLESAKIFFQFDHSLPSLNGRAILVVPNAVIGDAIPELIKIYINDSNPSTQWIEEVVMHELCHAIGCASHAVCNEPGYLMYLDAGGVLDGNRLDAIHIDEQHMMRAIRYLPNGYDLSSVENY